VCLCKYLDLVFAEKVVNQLRDEGASDMLIQSNIDRLVKIGVFFMVRSNKFLTDYAKTFKE
jgi:hypothetical protein